MMHLAKLTAAERYLVAHWLAIQEWRCYPCSWHFDYLVSNYLACHHDGASGYYLFLHSKKLAATLSSYCPILVFGPWLHPCALVAASCHSPLLFRSVALVDLRTFPALFPLYHFYPRPVLCPSASRTSQTCIQASKRNRRCRRSWPAFS